MSPEYSIKTDVFEGPLHLLISLIEKRKLLVNDISLSKVTDDYIAYIKNLSEFPLADSTQFIFLASTLVLIKSKSLLPTLSLTEEEESSIQELEDHLKIHQRYKHLSQHIEEYFGKSPLFFKAPEKEKPIVFSPPKNLTADMFLVSMKKVIAQIIVPEKIPKTVVKKIISLEEAIVALLDRVGREMKTSFKSVTSGYAHEKVAVAVTFLALLELVKQGVVQTKQDGIFYPIEIENGIVGVPRY